MHQIVRSRPPSRVSILILSLVSIGDSIASEGKGEYMYVEGRISDIHGKPVPDAYIETWETDSEGASLYGILHAHC